MRLSEAIRLGATISPQCFGRYGDHRGGTCAAGSAMLAIGQLKLSNPLMAQEFMRFFPEAAQAVDRPCGCRRRSSEGWLIAGVIPHLNDFHSWTREQIADWVDTVIPPQVVAFAGGQDDESADQSHPPVPAELADVADAAARDQFAHAPSSR